MAPLSGLLGGGMAGRRGVATKFCLGDGFIDTQTHLPLKFSFSSDIGHFILKMVKNAKFSSV